MSENHWSKKPNRDKVIKKISKAKKKNPTRYWLGKKLSPKHNRKLQEGRGKLKGKNHWNWKGGITPLVYQIRHHFKSRQWSSDIFTRDDFTCQLCGVRGCVIEADHYPKRFTEIFHENKIKSLEQALECEEFWNINNGRTLCKKCHNKTKGDIRNFTHT